MRILCFLRRKHDFFKVHGSKTCLEERIMRESFNSSWVLIFEKYGFLILRENWVLIVFFYYYSIWSKDFIRKMNENPWFFENACLFSLKSMVWRHILGRKNDESLLIINENSFLENVDSLSRNSIWSKDFVEKKKLWNSLVS